MKQKTFGRRDQTGRDQTQRQTDPEPQSSPPTPPHAALAEALAKDVAAMRAAANASDGEDFAAWRSDYLSRSDTEGFARIELVDSSIIVATD